MLKIGFVDYFMDNFHSANYPKWLHECSGGNIEVVCAYALAEPPKGGKPNEEWSQLHGIPLVSSVKEVIDVCDGIMVLAPSHPETHEELASLPLRSGKRVYVDKAFAPDFATAKRMFDLAEQYNTPCCSSSALAFVSDYEAIDRSRLHYLSSRGGGGFEVYAIHQFEPIVALMGVAPKRIMSVGTEAFPAFVIEFDDGRIAKTEQFFSAPFEMYAGYNDGEHQLVSVKDDLFKNFISRVAEFFETGKPVATKWQTLTVIALLDAARKALANPLIWVDV